jgi:hypothetical protein
MTRRERIAATLRGQTPDRIPRDYGALPGFCWNHPGAIERIWQRYPLDVADCGYRRPDGSVQGDPYAIGTYIDEWGCPFENIHGGVIGQVKHPLIRTYDDLAGFKAPTHLLGRGMEDVARTCAATDGFTTMPLAVQPFERMQFLRGTEALYRDLVRQPAGLMELRDMVHAFNLAWVKSWCATPIDCVVIADDWGAQHRLLISPKLWRSLFKPLYADYVSLAKAAGKFVLMHSDGWIFDIIEDLIEIGVDAINSQLFCMDIEELGRRYRGQVTFWGEIDRQHLLPFGTPEEVRQAVRRIRRSLDTGQGGVIAQCEWGVHDPADNIAAVFETWLENRATQDAV